MSAKRSKKETAKKALSPDTSSSSLLKKHKRLIENRLKIIKNSLRADTVHIIGYNEEKQHPVCLITVAKRGSKKGKDPQNSLLQLAERVFEDGKPLLENHIMGAPIILDGQSIAVVSVKRSEEKSYKKTNLTLLKNFALNISSFLEMAHKADMTQQLAVFDEMLEELSQKLSPADTIDQQAHKISTFVQKYFDDLLFGLFIVIDEKLLQFKAGNDWGIKQGTGLQFSKHGAIGWVAAEKAELLISDITADKRKIEGNKNIKSLLAIPLLRVNTIFGVIAFGSEKKVTWDEDLISTLRKISKIIAMNMCNAISFNELEYYSRKIENLNKFVNSVIKGFPSGIITIDKWGNITLINKKAQEVFGFTENDAKRITIKELFQRKNATINPFLTTLSENKPLTRIETTLVASNGKKVPIGFSTSLLRDESGDVIGAIGIMKELTKIKEEEEGLRREDRLVALGEMAAGMAHEIRNPLAGIRTGVEYLGRFLDEDKAEAVTMIIREIKRLNRIVTDMTSYANRPPIKLDKTAITEIIDISLGFLKNEIEERNIEIIKGYDKNIPSVFLDSDQIREVFDNILMNAMQATEKNGKIIVTTGTDESGKNVEVRITDNGCGISEADRERIFNPFFTTKKGGTGLGLSICYRIVSEHNGYMVISSKKGKGTTVKVVLPRTRES